MRINMFDVGGAILIFGAAIGLFQELWYIDNGFDLSLPIFYIPIIIMATGIVILIYDKYRR